MPIDWGALSSTAETEEPDWDAVEDAGAGEATPFRDPGLDEDEDTGPSFLGKRWRDITDPTESLAAWTWLREWTDWFVIEYRVSINRVPPCWYRHRAIVAELWAAANAEYKVWEEGAATTMPLTAWHSYLPGVLDRLGNAGGDRCASEKQHVEEASYGDITDPRALDVDEQDWAEHLHSVVDTETELEPGQWRMSAADAEGVVASSPAVTVSAGPQAPELRVDRPVLGFDGHGNPTLRARAYGADLTRTWWEHQQDGEWVTRLTSTRDVSVDNDETDGE